jgi:O-antigen/teichoic acid export membrane protein
LRSFISSLSRIISFQGFKNASWNLVGTISYPSLMLITTPLFINRLGATQFGIWILVNTITQMMSIFNMGLGDANVRYISKYNAEKDPKEINAIVSTTFSVGLVIGVVGVLIGFIISYSIGNTNWFDISKDNEPLIRQCIRLSFFLFSFKFIEIIALSVFQGFERYDLAAKYSLLSKSSILLANLLLILVGGDLVILFLNSAILQFIFVAVEVYFVKRKYPFITFKPFYNREKIRKVFGFSLWTWLQSVLAIGSSQADKFIVAYFSGVQVLSYYSLGYMLMTQVHAVFSTAIGWIFPVVSKKHTEGNSLKQLRDNAQAIFLAFGFGSLLIILFMQRPLFTLWLGEETYQNSSRFITLFLYYNLAMLVNIIPFFFLNGSGFARYNTYSEFITRSANIAGMVIFYHILGIEGLIWGHIVGMVVATPVKTHLMSTYVIQENNKFLSIQSTFCCVLVIVIFEMSNPGIKLLSLVVFIWVFYYLYVRPAQIKTILKHE